MTTTSLRIERVENLIVMQGALGQTKLHRHHALQLGLDALVVKFADVVRL